VCPYSLVVLIEVTLYSLVVLVGVTLCVSLRHDRDLSSLGKI
jgi:hypothetical protein